MAKKRDKSIAIKVVELILAAFIAKGLGFVREMALANYYGTSYVSDVFVAVQNIPAIIFTVAPIIPVITGFSPSLSPLIIGLLSQYAYRFFSPSISRLSLKTCVSSALMNLRIAGL